MATLANPKTPQRSPEWRYGLVSKDCNQHMHWNSWSQWIYVWIHLQQYFDCNSSQWKSCHWNHKHWWHLTQIRNPPQKSHLKLKSHALMIPDTDKIHPRKITKDSRTDSTFMGKTQSGPAFYQKNHKAMLCNHPKRIAAPIRNSHNPTRIHLVFLW